MTKVSSPTARGRGADTVRTRLTLPATFDFNWIRSFLTLRRVPSLERWSGDDVYIRSVCIDGAPTLLTIRYVTPGGRTRRDTSAGAGRASLDVSFTPAPALTLEAVRAAVGRMFDVDGDLETFIAHVRRDKLLGPLVKRRPHVRLPRLIDPFEGLVRAMLGQQITVRAASTMTDRFARRFGVPIDSIGTGGLDGPDAPDAPDTPDGREGRSGRESRDGLDGLYAFPRPDVIAGAGADALRAIGLTRAKATAIAKLAETLAASSGSVRAAVPLTLPSPRKRGEGMRSPSFPEGERAGVSGTAADELTRYLAAGRLDCARLAELPSDDVHAALVALPGIGPWTASYVRMRVLGDRDAFPAADLGVIKALEALGVPRPDHVATAERWRPWRAYAVLHLWESLSD